MMQPAPVYSKFDVLAMGTAKAVLRMDDAGTGIQWGLIYDGIAAGALTLAKTGTTARTATFPDAAITVAGLEVANIFTQPQVTLYNGGFMARQAAGQDGVAINGRAGGVNGYIATITPTTLSANRTLTAPDASIVLSGSASALTSGRVPYATTGGLLTDSATGPLFNGTEFGIGAAPTAGYGLLQLAIGTTKANGIGWNSSTNLYPTASGALKTDSSLTVAGAFSSPKGAGSYNEGYGGLALAAVTSGSANLGLGFQSCYAIVGGNYHIGIGVLALSQVTGSSGDVAIGYQAGYNGGTPLTAMDNCTFIGYATTSTANSITNSMALGANAQVTKSNQIVIGDGSITETLLKGTVVGACSYGQIYVADGVTAQSIANGATYVKLTGFNTAQGANGLSNDVTVDKTNSKITITRAGNYYVSFQISYTSGTANVTYRASVFNDGTESTNIHDADKAGAGADMQSFSADGIITVAANKDLDIRLRHDQGSAVNFTPVYMSLTVRRVG